MYLNEVKVFSALWATSFSTALFLFLYTHSDPKTFRLPQPFFPSILQSILWFCWIKWKEKTGNSFLPWFSKWWLSNSLLISPLFPRPVWRGNERQHIPRLAGNNKLVNVSNLPRFSPPFPGLGWAGIYIDWCITSTKKTSIASSIICAFYWHNPQKPEGKPSMDWGDGNADSSEVELHMDNNLHKHFIECCIFCCR